MRKLVGLLPMLLACLSFAACFDDDKVHVTTEMIVGEWKIVKVDGGDPTQPMTLDIRDGYLYLEVVMGSTYGFYYDYEIKGNQLFLEGEYGTAIAAVLSLTDTEARLKVVSNEEGQTLSGTIDCIRI